MIGIETKDYPQHREILPHATTASTVFFRVWFEQSTNLRVSKTPETICQTSVVLVSWSPTAVRCGSGIGFAHRVYTMPTALTASALELARQDLIGLLSH
jgi:hypothetical protein